jgi:hypothetical protein
MTSETVTSSLAAISLGLGARQSSWVSRPTDVKSAAPGRHSGSARCRTGAHCRIAQPLVR